MKKVLFILAFLAIGMIATAQTQTIYNQLKLATVNDATASDSLVLVQGTDKIVRKIPLSSISGSTEIPSLQEVTNNGNVTSHPIYAKEYRVESNVDSLMVLNNRYFSIGDFGNDYGGNWTKYMSVFDPNDYPDGFNIYHQSEGTGFSIDANRSETTNSYISMYASDNREEEPDTYSGYFRLNPNYLNMQLERYSVADGESRTNIRGNSTGFGVDYLGSQVIQTYQHNISLGDWAHSQNSVGINIENLNEYIHLATPTIRLNTYPNAYYGSLVVPNFSDYRTINIPDASGELLLKERDFGAYGSYNFGGQYSSYADLKAFKFETLGNGVDGFNTRFSLNVNPEEGANILGANSTNTTQGVVGVSQSDAFMFAADDTVGNSSYNLAADKFYYSFTSVADGADQYYFHPASISSGSESANYYMPMKSGHLAVVGQTAPASATAAGVVGEIRVTDIYVYVCVAENTWRRTALSTW